MNREKVDSVAIRTDTSTIHRYITNDDGVVRLSIRSSTGWELFFPPVDGNLSVCIRVCQAFTSLDAFEIIRRNADDLVHMIDLMVINLTAAKEGELDLGMIKMFYGEYYGQELRNIPFDYLLDQFRNHKIQDYLAWEYINRERLKRK